MRPVQFSLKNHLLWVLFFPLILGSCNGSEAPKQTKEKEAAVRGVWLTNVASDALYSRERIKEVVENCSELGFNSIFVVTWNKGYTIYPSEVMKSHFGQSIIPDMAGRD
jgi:uncharacterized lipoprotein YddW (UPF0748 family)